MLVALAIGSLVGGFQAMRHFGSNATALRETWIVLTGRPVFLSGGSNGSVIARLSSDPQERTFLWPQNSLPAGSMSGTKDLRFTFFEARPGPLPPLELARIEDDSGTLYDASICPIHRQTMHRTRVVMAPSSEQAFPSPSTESGLFPHCGVVVGTKGMGSYEIPTWVCDSCRRERDRWLDKAHRSASLSK